MDGSVRTATKSEMKPTSRQYSSCLMVSDLQQTQKGGVVKFHVSSSLWLPDHQGALARSASLPQISDNINISMDKTL